MSTIADKLTSSKNALEGALRLANQTTEASDTNICDALNTLISGYGQGGGSDTQLADYMMGNLSGDVIINHSGTIINNMQNQPNITSLEFVNSLNYKGGGYNIATINSCSACKTIRFKSDNQVGKYSYTIGAGMTSLESIYIDAIAVHLMRYFIDNSTPSLKKVDISYAQEGTFSNAFQFKNAQNLKALIIRGNSLFANVASAQAIPSTWETTPLYIYVPRNLVETYKSDTEWSTYASNIRAIEDYSVDGTVTGEIIID